MRGVRACSILLRHRDPARLVRLSRLEEGPGRRHAEAGQGLHRRGGQDRRARDQVGVRRPDDAAEERDRLGDRAAGRRAPPDQAAVSGITSNLSSLEIQRVIDENPPDLKEYGLAAPRIEVAFKAGGQQRRLQHRPEDATGHATSTPSSPDSKRVFLIPSFLDSTFNRSTFDLRDKAVLKIDREKVDALEVDAEGTTRTRFEKKNGEWQIAAAGRRRGRSSARSTAWSRGSARLQMKSIVHRCRRI